LTISVLVTLLEDAGVDLGEHADSLVTPSTLGDLYAIAERFLGAPEEPEEQTVAAADPGGSGTPSGDATPAEGTPSGDDDDADEGEGDTVPAAFLGTWTTTIGTADERRLVLRQGEVGDTVLSLTATGPIQG
ncbi:hypothetical protein ADL27_41685, partial [Streptomyces sp. NRRL F-6602]